MLVYVLGRLLQLLHPFAPFVTESLWQQLGFTGSISISQRPDTFELAPKNYRIKLIMDIITELRNLRTKVTTKNHEKIDVFVQASSDMISYVQEMKDLIIQLVGVETLECFRE